MAAYHLAGLIIACIGLMLMFASAPALKFAGRNSIVEPQFSPRMMAWLTRGLGLVFTLLGVVTYLQP